jgi:putative transposase
VGRLDYQGFTRRRRPHLNPPDGTLFLTFRLFDSIPKSVVREYRAKLHWLKDQLRRLERLSINDDSDEMLNWHSRLEQLNRDWFLKTEEMLHRSNHGPVWMADPTVADKVAENLHRLDGASYRLDAYSIISNHVHTVFKPFLSQSELILLDDELLNIGDNPGLSKIMHSLKGRSARECNLLLGRSGSFWEHESFDHAVREGKFDKTMRYVLNNPVKAGLVSDWENWRWNYCRDELVERYRAKERYGQDS